MKTAKEILEQYERCSFVWKHQNAKKMTRHDFVMQGYIAGLSFALDTLGIAHEAAGKVLGLVPKTPLAQQVRSLFGLDEGGEA